MLPVAFHRRAPVERSSIETAPRFDENADAPTRSPAGDAASAMPKFMFAAGAGVDHRIPPFDAFSAYTIPPEPPSGAPAYTTLPYTAKAAPRFSFGRPTRSHSREPDVAPRAHTLPARLEAENDPAATIESEVASAFPGDSPEPEALYTHRSAPVETSNDSTEPLPAVGAPDTALVA